MGFGRSPPKADNELSARRREDRALPRRSSLTSERVRDLASYRPAARGCRGAACPSAGGAPAFGVCIVVSQYGQTCHIGSSGALQLEHACLSFVVQTGQTRKLGSTSAVADREAMSAAAARLIARISSSRSRRSSMNSGGRKSM